MIYQFNSIDENTQKEELMHIKKLVTDEWRLNSDVIEEHDIILKKKFDKIIDSAIESKWINKQYVETYIQDIKNIFANEDLDGVFSILVYTNLVNIFKKSLLKQKQFIKDIITISFYGVPLTNYEKCGSVLLNDTIIEKLYKLNDLKKETDIPLRIDIQDLLNEINLEYQPDLLISNSVEFLDNKIRDKEIKDQFCVINDDSTIMDVYNYVKNNIDGLLFLNETIFDDSIYDDIKKILKIKKLSIDKQNEYIKLAKHVYDSENILMHKIDFIIKFAEIYTENLNDKIVNYDFQNKKI